MGAALSRALWRLASRFYRVLDVLYRRWHRLEPVGKLLYVGRGVHRGEPRRLADGTEVAPGDAIGTLHFDNQFIAGESGAADSAAASGIRFARRFFPAFKALARRASEDPGWSDLVAFHAVGWFPPHGERYGFEFSRLPPGRRARWLRWHISNLVMAFNPEAGRRERQRLWPMEIWLSRRQLLESFLERRARR